MYLWNNLEKSPDGVKKLAGYFADTLMNQEYADALDFFTMEEQSRLNSTFRDDWVEMTEEEPVSYSSEFISLDDLEDWDYHDKLQNDIAFVTIAFSNGRGDYFVSGMGYVDRDDSLKLRNVKMGLLGNND